MSFSTAAAEVFKVPVLTSTRATAATAGTAGDGREPASALVAPGASHLGAEAWLGGQDVVARLVAMAGIRGRLGQEVVGRLRSSSRLGATPTPSKPRLLGMREA